MSASVSAAASRHTEAPPAHASEAAKAVQAKRESIHHEPASKPAEHVGKKVDVKA